MKRVLLVDDEVFVRKGLTSLINWEKCGLEIFKEANNGEDALAIITENNPEVVITDIRMPVLDGLELIKQSNIISHVSSKFIIISGYDDFKYAQQAVRYGVHDFILKPIDKDEMESALIKLVESIDQEEKMKIGRVQQSLLRLQDALLSDEGEFELDDIQIDHLRATGENGFYYCLFDVMNRQIIQNEIDDFSRKFCVAMQNVTQETNPIPLFKHDGHLFGTLITQSDLANFESRLDFFSAALNRELERLFNDKILVYIGKEVKKIGQAKISYLSAKHASQYKYTSLSNKVILYDKVKDIQIHYTEIDQHMFLSLMEHVENNNTQSIIKIIQLIFQDFKEQYFAPEAVVTSINRCIHSVIDTIKKLGGNEAQIESLESMLAWETHNVSLDQLKEMLTEFILNAAALIVTLRRQVAKGDIHIVKTYIESHFRENISLRSIGNDFFINPVYLGQVFRKTYGMYFKEYLLELRINEAKKLLRQTNKRVYEVAESVGFGSTDYFVTQFEKEVGLTPTEYRNKFIK